MIVVTKDKYVSKGGVFLDPTSDTEQVGYRTVKQQVEALDSAGQRLINWRNSVYNTQSEVDKDSEYFPDDVPIVDGTEDITELTDIATTLKRRVATKANKAKEQPQVATPTQEPDVKKTLDSE